MVLSSYHGTAQQAEGKINDIIHSNDLSAWSIMIIVIIHVSNVMICDRITDVTSKTMHILESIYAGIHLIQVHYTCIHVSY